jgi:hypothetical protein
MESPFCPCCHEVDEAHQLMLRLKSEKMISFKWNATIDSAMKNRNKQTKIHKKLLLDEVRNFRQGIHEFYFVDETHQQSKLHQKEHIRIQSILSKNFFDKISDQKAKIVFNNMRNKVVTDLEEKLKKALVERKTYQ